MDLADVFWLRARAATVDTRIDPEDEAAASGWLWVLEPYHLDDAVAALREHFRTQPDRDPKPGHLSTIIDGWDEQWLNGQRTGPRPPGGPHGAEELISGEEWARRQGLTIAQPTRALPGGEPQ